MIGWAWLVATESWSNTIADGFVLPKLCVLIAAASVILCSEKCKVQRPPKALLVLLAISACSALRGDNPQLSMFGFSGFPAYSVLGLALLTALTCFQTDSRLGWLKVAGVALSCHALLQKAGLDPLLAYERLPGGRAVAYIGSPVDLGAVLAMAFPVVPARWRPLLAGGLWATGSRAAWGAAAVSVTPRRWLPIFLLPAVWIFLHPRPTDLARIELWKMAGKSFVEKPVLGHGPGSFIISFGRLKTKKFDEAMGKTTALQAQAHNDLLEALSTVGILGAAAYLIFVVPLLGHPSLLALFVVGKVDPVGFEVLACAALIIAVKIREEKTK